METFVHKGYGNFSLITKSVIIQDHLPYSLSTSKRKHPFLVGNMNQKYFINPHESKYISNTSMDVSF